MCKPSPNSVGKAGEQAAGITKNKQVVNMYGRNRIPDEFLDHSISEVKNVKYQSYTLQLRDYFQYAKDTGRSMTLITRKNTVLSKPLEKSIQ